MDVTVGVVVPEAVCEGLPVAPWDGVRVPVPVGDSPYVCVAVIVGLEDCVLVKACVVVGEVVLDGDWLGETDWLRVIDGLGPCVGLPEGDPVGPCEEEAVVR